MKLFKKVLAVTAVLTLALSTVPVSAATTDVVDFENGDMTGFSLLLTDGDSDQAKISVKDLNGSKALFIDKQEAGKIAKVNIDAVALVGADNLDKINSVTFDVTVVSPDGSKLEAWNGGGIGAKIGADGSVWYQGGSWEASDAENPSVTINFKETFVKGMAFTKGASAGGYLFMNWSGNLNDFYIDNVKFLDASGKALPLLLGASDAAAEDTAAAADDAEAATDTAAADTAAATKDVPKTGSTSYALFFLAGAAVMLTGAVVMKRRKVDD